MTSIDPGYASGASATGARSHGAVLAAFVSAIFTSAFLLFAVQPMFTKMVLPLLGGTPAVWSVAMVFFQSLLLAGYAYAHFSTKHLSHRNAVIVHLALFGLTALALPIAISTRLGEPPAEWQEFWLIGVFMASVGLPFFAVSANGPLLQAWFARSGHPTAHDPYYLYGASNLGSFAALLLYPLLIEPLLPLKAQTGLWSLGFCVLGAMIGIAGLMAQRSGAEARANSPVAAEIVPAPSMRDRLVWIFLAAIPSGLLVAVTAHVSTDVAASPFLWVIPLALYLGTFIVVFRDPLPFSLEGLERILPIIAASLCLYIFLGTSVLMVAMIVHFAFLTVATLVCHARLYTLRPHARHLTTFYLCMSIGGVIGGLFCGLIAPNVFNRIAEYPILIVASFLCLPGVYKAPREQWTRQALPWLAGLGVVYVLTSRFPEIFTGSIKQTVVYALLGLAGLAVVLYRRPLMASAICAGLFMAMGPLSLGGKDEYTTRSFFGVHKVQVTNDGQFRNLVYGTTVHGAMRIKDNTGAPLPFKPEPTTYYHKTGPMAEAIRTLQQRPGGLPRSFGVVGLGAGAMVCHGRTNDSWTFFEIDPVVVRLATTPAYFRFISACAPQTRMVVGDARLTLAKETGPFDTLIIDAFASDAIPVHLMTREALAMYVGRVGQDGLLVLHISNRHLELESVVATLAKDLGLEARAKFDNVTDDEMMQSNKMSSHVVALSKSADAMKALDALGWRAIRDKGTTAWTDDYSNIIGAMWRNHAD